MKTRKQSLKSLVKEADKLFQIKMIQLYPVSLISGEPTEVIHHFVNKSKSNNLRYDQKNGIPLTNKEHAQHHISGDPAIIARITMANGQEWFDDLQQRRRIDCTFNKGYLQQIITKINSW